MTTKKAALLLPHGLLLVLCPCDMRAQQSSLDTNAPAGQYSGIASISPKPPANLTVNLPHVSCHGNGLTISAENSTLGSILSAVHTCIGVDIDIPDAEAGELSYVQLGPGPTREVLGALLSSTQLDYAIQTSNSQPEKISRILLMARVKGVDGRQEGLSMPAAPELTMTPARQAWLASVRALRAGAQTTDNDQTRVVGAEPATLDTANDVQHGQAGPGAAITDASAINPTGTTETTAKDAKVEDQQATVPSDPTSAATPPNPASPLQNKIDEMQQLFEQRKKMMADFSVTPGQK